jgi:hypothetical protein
MSHPDDPTPAPPAPPAPVEAPPAPIAPPAPVEAASEPSVIEPPVPSGPYRIPAPPDTITSELHFGPPPRKPRPLLGPTLSVFAVTLWTFVIAGQFASSWTLGVQVRNGEATLLVLAATVAAWVVSVRRSREVVPPRSTFHLVWRAIGVGVLAFFLFIACLVAAMAVNSAMNVDFLVAAGLVLLSLLAALAGAHLTSPTKPVRTPAMRAIQIALWVAGALLTFVAGADLGANG